MYVVFFALGIRWQHDESVFKVMQDNKIVFYCMAAAGALYIIIGMAAANTLLDFFSKASKYLLYYVVQGVYAAGMVPTAINLFHSFANKEMFPRAARSAYAMYFIHPCVLILVVLLWQAIYNAWNGQNLVFYNSGVSASALTEAEAWISWLCVALLSLPLTFLAGVGLLKIPGSTTVF